jgi:hypothetical protein
VNPTIRRVRISPTELVTSVRYLLRIVSDTWWTRHELDQIHMPATNKNVKIMSETGMTSVMYKS